MVKMNLASRGVGVLLLLLVAACSGTTAAPLAAPVPLVVAASLLGPRTPRPDVREASPTATKDAAVVVTPLPQAALPPSAPVAPVVVATAPVAESPAPMSPRQAVVKDLPAVEPLLDIAALKLRLRETAAIGMFTKLALKNQVDDLLMMFRIGHEGGDSQKVSIPSLRTPYNALLAKVVSLVAAGDPPLARTLVGSREAIWGILADPQKFKAAT